jgi:hypothetical protein
VKFGNITYGRILVFNGGVVHAHGKIHLPPGVSDLVWHTSYLWFKETTSIMIGDTGSLMASYIQLHSHGNIHTAAGAEITSLMKHECNIHEHNHLFSCIPRHTLDADITEQSFVSHFNKRFKADIQSVEDALQVLS